MNVVWIARYALTLVHLLIDLYLIRVIYITAMCSKSFDGDAEVCFVLILSESWWPLLVQLPVWNNLKLTP